jgi:hypothetical protein
MGLTFDGTSVVVPEGKPPKPVPSFGTGSVELAPEALRVGEDPCCTAVQRLPDPVLKIKIKYIYFLFPCLNSGEGSVKYP